MTRNAMKCIGVSEPYESDLSERSYVSGAYHVEILGRYDPQYRVYTSSVVCDYIYAEYEIPEI